MDSFPVTYESQGWDSNQYEVSAENPAITTDMEGGYMTSRPRHTRAPRKTFRMGWQSTSDVVKWQIDNFWAQMRGSGAAFLWLDPDNGIQYTVRFRKEDPVTFKYVGMGEARLWDIQLVLEQV